ncbi:MAG: hypothetical protein M2R45_00091 [Verrucomicrobia subdivision 3 bacterium]|nr:hypothetical protein [Limisphaerales bacterium]MCS1412450.1 hypothetical protein [Limisphaerales bacterium]
MLSQTFTSGWDTEAQPVKRRTRGFSSATLSPTLFEHKPGVSRDIS